MTKFHGVEEPSNLDKWTQAARDAWRMGVLDTLDALNITETESECPYTHAHTRHWCGYPTCRES